MNVTIVVIALLSRFPCGDVPWRRRVNKRACVRHALEERQLVLRGRNERERAKRARGKNTLIIGIKHGNDYDDCKDVITGVRHDTEKN